MAVPSAIEKNPLRRIFLRLRFSSVALCRENVFICLAPPANVFL
jgi:hypothetical protein